MTMETNITTVGEMKKFLENFKDDDKILFSDGDIPCSPPMFKVMSVSCYANEWSDYDEDELKELEETRVKLTDVVIYVDF